MGGNTNEKLNELFEANQKLAYKIANEYLHKNNLYDVREDLYQCALEGLWIACLQFDESRGFKFSTFAHHKIFGAVTGADTHRTTLVERRKIKRNNLDIRVSYENDVMHENKQTKEKEMKSMINKLKQDEVWDDEWEGFIDFKTFANSEYVTEWERELIKHRLNNLTQPEIAKLYGVKQPTVSRWFILIKNRWELWQKYGGKALEEVELGEDKHGEEEEDIRKNGTQQKEYIRIT